MKYFLTMLGCKVLTGQAGDVAVKSCPSRLAVADPGCDCLSTAAAVLTFHLAAHVHNVL